ncbi:MAG: right-handed parallel beta-helix repeat-containing protein, partial [Planctomycetota bacterium]
IDTGYARGLEPRPGEPAVHVTPPLQPFSTLSFDPKKFTPRRWAHPETAVLHIFQSRRWSNLQWRLKEIDYDGRSIALGEGGWQIGTLWETARANWVGGGSPYFIENVFEELDAPGEWYFDAPNHVLYYLPHEDEDVANAEFVGCVLKELVVLEGTAENPVHDVHFRGITFAHTARTMLEPYETRLRGDWAIARRAAVRFDGAADCSVVDCRFVHLGGNAVLLSNYNRRIEVADSLFTDIGDSGVLAVGNDDAVRELRVHRTYHVPLDELTDLEPGPKSPNYPGECTIRNNLMYRLGVVGKQTAGVYLSACERIHVAHNTICLVPRAAICINDGCWGGHLIEFNDAFLTVLETSDHGPMNAWGRDRYWQSLHRENKPCDMSLSKKYATLDNYLPTVIRNNRFSHDGFSWGIDLDDGASNYVVENNLCLGCSVKLREGFFRRVHNNIFVGPNPPSKHCCFEGNDDVFTNNIVVNTRDAWAMNRGPATVHLPKEIDRNVYWNTVGEPPLFGYQGAIDGEPPRRRTLSLAQWQALGADEHSVFADPLFVGMERGDFRLQPESPALRLGFKPFPLDRFGTRKPEFAAVIAAEGLR